MEGIGAAPVGIQGGPDGHLEAPGPKEPEVVSTYVLVPEEQIERLRELSRPTWAA